MEFMLNPCRTSFGEPLGAEKRFLMFAITVFLVGCSKPAPRAQDIRPVRVMHVAAEQIGVVAEFPGEVRPRVESRLGFRVGGKIVARKVDVGTVVKRGQVLMQLDPQDLKLAQSQANSGLKAAESNRALARSELMRYKELREKNFVSQAVLDAKETAYKAANASYEQAVASYKNQSNQTAYTSLVADVDGVVTSVDAEAGQVVAPGVPVVRVAQMNEKEIVIAIPENKVDALRRVSDIRVRIWAKPDHIFTGRLREISPVADPVTRTYTAKVAIADAGTQAADVKLGMTAYVSFATQIPNAVVKLPLTALVQEKNASAVWVVENGAVRLTPVEVARPLGNDILIASGIAPGQTIVTAGVNLLKPGQKVKLLEQDAAITDGAAAHGPAAALPVSSAVTAGNQPRKEAPDSGAAK